MVSKEDLIKALKENPYLVAHQLGYTGFTKLHNDWLKMLIYGKDNFTLQAHRGSYKTTCLIIAISLIILLRPTKTIGFFRKTDDNVKEVVKGVAKALQTELFQNMALILYGYPMTFETLTANIIDTNLNISNSGTPQLTGRGFNGSITGKHYDYIFTDDIVAQEDRTSPAERERTKEKFLEVLNLVNRGDGCFIKNIGTPWHKDDAFKLMPKPIKYDCYTTGLMSEEQIKDLKSKMTPSLFAANYELKHISDEEMLFFDPKFMKESEFNNLDGGFLHIDASYGGEDYTAFTLCRFRNGKFYVYGKLIQKHVDNCLMAFKEIADKYKCFIWFVENNGDKGYLAENMNKMGMNTESYHENTNKYLKITSYLYADWKNVYFHPDTDEEYIEQILDFNKFAEHDDAPDSLASIIREIRKKLGITNLTMTSAF